MGDESKKSSHGIGPMLAQKEKKIHKDPFLVKYYDIL